MNFGDKVRFFLTRWMTGRYGPDQLGMLTLSSGLLLSVTGSLCHLSLLSLLGLLLYFITLFRMFSRKISIRASENRKYMLLTGQWVIKSKQFLRRMKYRKDYKYFKCPQCKQLLRLKRGCGEKTITCAKCGHQFTQRA